MPLSSPPTAVAPFDKGRLSAGITAAATTLYVSPIFKTVAGVRVKQGINTTSGCAIISAGDFTELITYTGISVDAATKVTTITGLTRGRDPTQTTASGSFAGGTGRIWAKGAKFTVVADVTYFQSGVFTNVANTFTAIQTFSEAPVFSKGIRLTAFANTAARDAYFTAPTEGAKCVVTSVGEQVYFGGAWVTVNAAASSLATSIAQGTVEVGVAADNAASTGAGTSGALVVVPTSLVVKTSSGAGDENKIPVLNAVGQIASGFIPNTSSGDGSDGNVTLGMDTTITRDMFYNDLNLSTFTLNTAGFRVYAKGTISGSGKIKATTGNTGTAGVAASGGTLGGAGAAGTASGAGSLPQTVAGVAGSAGVAGVSSNTVGTAGIAGTAGGAVTNSIASTAGTAGGASGAGGAGSGNGGGASGAGGAAGTATAASRSSATFYEIFATIAGGTWTPFSAIGKGGGGGGGGSGGRNATSGASGGGGGGGGSGASGGFFFIAAQTISGTWNIESIGGVGGAGGNGGNSTADSASGGGGGGGGGAGGPGGSGILMRASSSGWSGTTVLTGGVGGAGGTGGTNAGEGVNGSSGSSGNTGSSGTLLTITI